MCPGRVHYHCRPGKMGPLTTFSLRANTWIPTGQFVEEAIIYLVVRLDVLELRIQPHKLRSCDSVVPIYHPQANIEGERELELVAGCSIARL